MALELNINYGLSLWLFLRKQKDFIEINLYKGDVIQIGISSTSMRISKTLKTFLARL